MEETKKQFEHVIAVCRDLFAKKLHDYGAAWRIMRPSSVTDQIFIKANRIRSIEVKGVSLINEGFVRSLLQLSIMVLSGLFNLNWAMPRRKTSQRNVRWNYMMRMQIRP